MSKSELPEDARQERNRYMRAYNASLSDEAKEQRRQYQKEYRQRPEAKEKLKVYQARFWEKKARQAGLIGTVKNSEPTKIKNSEPTKTTKKCEYCGNEFTPIRKTAKYCCDACRSAFNKRK